MTDSPGIDVVIPTMNCGAKLRRCLSRIRAQDYLGRLEVFVVDGGSSDDSVGVAREFGATVYVNPGQYSSGLDGARHFGESKGDNPFVWNIDADNFLVESSCVTDLIWPLLKRPDLSFTFPEIAIDPNDSPFNNYLSLDERTLLDELKRGWHQDGGAFITENCPYGLTNATLIRREALERAGGYDSDVLLLGRLRALGIAKAALITTAHFIHSQTVGPADYRKKWLRRARHFASMTPAARERFFARTGSRPTEEDPVLSRSKWIFTNGPKRAIGEFIRTGNPVWLNGLAYTAIVVSIALAHPIVARRALAVFLERQGT